MICFKNPKLFEFNILLKCEFYSFLFTIDVTPADQNK